MAYLFLQLPARSQSSSERDCARLARAKRLFAAFAGCAPPRIAAQRIERRIPGVLVDLGALRGVIYTKDHGDTKRTYIHFMDDPPRLLCDEHGKQLYVQGGSYRITRRGIEG